MAKDEIRLHTFDQAVEHVLERRGRSFSDSAGWTMLNSEDYFELQCAAEWKAVREAEEQSSGSQIACATHAASEVAATQQAKELGEDPQILMDVYQTRIEDLSRSLDSLRESRAAINAEYDAAMNEVASLTARVNRADAALEELTHELQDKITLLKTSEKNKEFISRMLDVVRSDRSSINAAYCEAMYEIAQKDSDIVGLKQLLDRVAGELQFERENGENCNGCWSCGCDEGDEHGEDCLALLVKQALA